jgi:hypothetical protein
LHGTSATTRRFPPPWSIEELDTCFVVRDHIPPGSHGTVMAVQYLLTNAPSGGYYTPSMLLGAHCVEQLPGSTSIRVE